MKAVGRIFKYFTVVLLIIAVWAVLVAPDFDLDPTLLGGKQSVQWSQCAIMLLCALLACLTMFEQLRLRLRTPLETVPSPIELTCARLC